MTAEVNLWNPETLAMNSNKASSVAEAKSPSGSVLEIKYDGWRILTHISDVPGDVPRRASFLYTRQGRSQAGKLPHIEESLKKLPSGTWLDGEAVAFRPDGTQFWGGAQSVLGSDATRVMDRKIIKYVLFDVLAYAGEDVRSKPFRERRALLEKIFEEHNLPHVMLSLQTEATEANHDAFLEMGFEGSMVKHLNAPYRSGKRVSTSLKLKATDTEDVIITGFKPPKPGWIERMKLIGSVEFIASDGVTGACSGMTVPERVYFTEHQRELIGTVIEVSYMTKMPGGAFRHPNFIRFRPDKTVKEVNPKWTA